MIHTFSGLKVNRVLLKEPQYVTDGIDCFNVKLTTDGQYTRIRYSGVAGPHGGVRLARVILS